MAPASISVPLTSGGKMNVNLTVKVTIYVFKRPKRHPIKVDGGRLRRNAPLKAAAATAVSSCLVVSGDENEEWAG
ncbi:hypothetical protein VP1G_11345 [Cytospora mali]|uniref:Uncharacterized protein n=1 Tax=Cytospora mali TaxID=578113 RepID=A0A194VDA5_CYTMA|nr:hypothetical protein VP1G_11345 [Valsa mali var. pyri (nom. inval.)]